MNDRRRRALALQNAQQPPEWYRVGPVLALAADGQPVEDVEAAATTSADVYVYNTIGGWFGMTANDFVRDVASLDVDRLVVHLNSPGGDAMEGVAIANVLRAHRADVVVRVDGIAASAASVIAMAGSEVVMGVGSQLMIHDAWGYAMGNAAEMQQAARMLDSTSDSYASAYASKAGGTTAEWRDAMRSESWYTAAEAVEAGLADRVAAADETGTAEGQQVTPGASSGGFWDLWDSLSTPDRFDLSAYRYPGRDHAPEPPMPGRTTPAASAAGRHTEKRSANVAPFLDDVRSRLGVPDDADEAAVLAALDTRLAEPAPQARAAVPDGMALIERTTLDGLRADAQAGRDARDRQLSEDRERQVDAAIADGRIAPARRAAWLTKLEADPGEAETLASLEKGLVPVDQPRGHAERTEEPEASVQSGAALYRTRNGRKD